MIIDKALRIEPLINPTISRHKAHELEGVSHNNELKRKCLVLN